MSRRYTRFFAIAILLGLSAIFARADEFKWKLKKGEQYEFYVEQEMQQQVPTPQGIVKTKVNLGLIGLWDITSVTPEGNMVLKQRIKRIAIHIDAPGQEPIVVDTDKLDQLKGAIAAQYGAQVAKLKQIEVTRTVSPQGAALTSEIKDTEGLGGAAGMTPENIDKLTGYLFLNFPATLTKGQSWTKRDVLKTPGVAVTVETKFTFAGTESVDGRTLAKFTVDGTFSTTPKKEAGEDAKKSDGQGGVGQPKIDGKTTGTIYFDQQLGRFDHGTTKDNFSARVSLFGRSFTSNTTVENAMRLKKVEKKIESSQGSP